MIFNTAWFLSFFVLYYVLFLLIPNARIRFYFTLACSAIFHYHFAGPAGITPIVIMGIVTYFFALRLAKIPQGRPRRKAVFVSALTVPVLGLVGYKYRALLFNSLTFFIGGHARVWLLDHAVTPALPLAISFFTFEFVHYLTDVYHGSKPIKNPFSFGIFSIFFPSIVSGPIKRYQDFLGQLEFGWPRPNAEDTAEGIKRLIVGYFKKLVIADNATILIHLLERKTDGSSLAVTTLMALLSIRILFDFSGYSDIAIGLARLLGIRLPENFNFPYIASNIAEFWGRWHMSLSSWIRDYIYIPLGGNRHGLARKFFNLILAMFICGLWHGAAWHFGIWGAYIGLGLVAHGIWEKSTWSKPLVDSRAWHWCGVGLNNVFVAYGWLLFFYPVSEVTRYTMTFLGW
jgi:alginate O-acetyltransferase complex protein AlgI